MEARLCNLRGDGLKVSKGTNLVSGSTVFARALFYLDFLSAVCKIWSCIILPNHTNLITAENEFFRIFCYIDVRRFFWLLNAAYTSFYLLREEELKTF